MDGIALRSPKGRPDPDLLMRALRFGVPASLVLHLLFLYLLAKSPPAVSTPDRVLTVTFEPRPEEPKPRPAPESPRQITTASVTTEPTTTERAPPTLLSDRDATVKREQIRRGAEDAGPKPGRRAPPDSAKGSLQPPVKPPKGSRPEPPVTNGAARSSNHGAKSSPIDTRTDLPKGVKLGSLTLDRDTLLKKYGTNERTEPDPMRSATSSGAIQPLGSYRAFSRPSGSGARFVGTTGSSDHLPNLPDGDITLLNTKADQFAVFVRRVASQVFSELRSAGWETLRAEDILQIRHYVTVRATLSPKGALLDVTLDDSSGNPRFDDTLVAATRKGARDANPPAGARAADGTIRFIFKSRSWVQRGVHARSGAPVERRWLLLATGLE